MMLYDAPRYVDRKNKNSSKPSRSSKGKGSIAAQFQSRLKDYR
jgi:hypothetical protein